MAISSVCAATCLQLPSSNLSAINAKPKLSLLSLPSIALTLKPLKPSQQSTFKVFAAPEVLDSQETLDGSDSAALEVEGPEPPPGSSPLSIGADVDKCGFPFERSFTSHLYTLKMDGSTEVGMELGGNVTGLLGFSASKGQGPNWHQVLEEVKTE
ncbi:hypothetical protein TEA_029616 [Camellia sinensis var. sinensis]|uniref:Uncharacterized protein n=1 Tax=Camellia sinensis var. sinensis TaxID=542762 RepID=A0A4S4DP21_CAMSN|nr:hypothetical protein TEA_029616 [Camellia sinensis var. sinensis]